MMIKTIDRPPTSKPAESVQVGDVTIDGVVLRVQPVGNGIVAIEHRNVTYTEEIGAPVQVYARLTHDMASHATKDSSDG